MTMLGFIGAGITTVALPAIAVHTGLAAGFAMMSGLYILAVIVLLGARPIIKRVIAQMAAEVRHG